MYDLYASLVEFSDASQLFAHVDVWIVTLGERRLELLKLFLCERCPMTSSRRRLARRSVIQHVTSGHVTRRHRCRHDTTSGGGRGAVQQAAHAFWFDFLERALHSFRQALLYYSMLLGW